MVALVVVLHAGGSLAAVVYSELHSRLTDFYFIFSSLYYRTRAVLKAYSGRAAAKAVVRTPLQMALCMKAVSGTILLMVWELLTCLLRCLCLR